MKLLLVTLLLVVTAGVSFSEQISETLKPGPSVPLMQLIEMLQNEDRSTRSRAAYYIGEQGSAAAEAVPALLEQIDRDEPEFLISSALGALGKVGEGRAQTIPTLFGAFNRAPSGARWYAAEGLVHIGEAAVPTLLAGTRSEIVTEEMWSHVCLAQIRGFESAHFQFVLDAFSSDDRTRSAIALRGLAMMDRSLPADTLPHLLDALARPVEDSFHRTEILAIIGHMRKKSIPAIPEIIPLLDDPDYMVRLRVVQALGNIGGSPAAPAVPALIRLLDRNMDISGRNTAAALSEIAGPRAKSSDSGSIRILNSDSVIPPKYILNTLGSIGAEAAPAIPQLVEVMLHDLPGREGQFAANALLKIAANSPEVRQGFITAMKIHGNTDNDVAIHYARIVPVYREWIDIFFKLYEQGYIPQRTLDYLYSRVSLEEQKRFPVQFERSNFDSTIC